MLETQEQANNEKTEQLNAKINQLQTDLDQGKNGIPTFRPHGLCQ